MSISMIVAIDSNNAIGKNGDQLAYISADLKHFKEITTGHTVVMGRKTSDALPKGILPNRRNIIITRSHEFQRNGAEIAHDVQEVINMTHNDDEVIVMGGGEIYRQFLPIATTLYITEIDYSFQDVDTFFPPIDNQWAIDSQSEWFTDEKTSLNFRFVKYIR